MIDVDSERLFSLSQATRFPCFCRNGRAPNASTLWRWAMHGIRGVKLETATVGGTLCTSRQAARRFIEQLSTSRR